MKKSIFLLSLLLTAGLFRHCISQTETSTKVARVGAVIKHAELTYQVSNTDTMYTLEYYNYEKYNGITNDYQKFSFPSQGNALNDLYIKLKSFFTEENREKKKYTIDFKLGKERVTVKHYRPQIKPSIQLIFNNGTAVLTEKQVDKLFGKLKDDQSKTDPE